MPTVPMSLLKIGRHRLVAVVDLDLDGVALYARIVLHRRIGIRRVAPAAVARRSWTWGSLSDCDAVGDGLPDAGVAALDGDTRAVDAAGDGVARAAAGRLLDGRVRLERARQIDHAEHQQEEDRRDERELSERLAALGPAQGVRARGVVFASLDQPERDLLRDLREDAGQFRGRRRLEVVVVRARRTTTRCTSAGCGRRCCPDTRFPSGRWCSCCRAPSCWHDAAADAEGDDVDLDARVLERRRFGLRQRVDLALLRLGVVAAGRADVAVVGARARWAARRLRRLRAALVRLRRRCRRCRRRVSMTRKRRVLEAECDPAPKRTSCPFFSAWQTFVPEPPVGWPGPRIA